MNRENIERRLESQHWLRRNGLIDTDYWRMDSEGNITFYPPMPKGMKITKEDINE